VKHIPLTVLAVMVLATSCLPTDSLAGGRGPRGSARLDDTLMGFKEQGIWYFLCTAPVFDQRIPPHYLTYGPPPPNYCPPPVPVTPRKAKICPVGPGMARPKTVLPPKSQAGPPVLPRPRN